MYSKERPISWGGGGGELSRERWEEVKEQVGNVIKEKRKRWSGRKNKGGHCEGGEVERALSEWDESGWGRKFDTIEK